MEANDIGINGNVVHDNVPSLTREIENRMKNCAVKEIVTCSIKLVKDDIEKRDGAVTFNC